MREREQARVVCGPPKKIEITESKFQWTSCLVYNEWFSEYYF